MSHVGARFRAFGDATFIQGGSYILMQLAFLAKLMSDTFSLRRDFAMEKTERSEVADRVRAPEYSHLVFTFRRQKMYFQQFFGPSHETFELYELPCCRTFHTNTKRKNSKNSQKEK